MVYQETTRFRLNDIVIRLVGRDRSQLKKFLRRLDSLVPCMKDEEAGDGMFMIHLPGSCTSVCLH